MTVSRDLNTPIRDTAGPRVELAAGALQIGVTFAAAFSIGVSFLSASGCDDYPTPRVANPCARTRACLTEGRCLPREPGLARTEVERWVIENTPYRKMPPELFKKQKKGPPAASKTTKKNTAASPSEPIPATEDGSNAPLPRAAKNVRKAARAAPTDIPEVARFQVHEAIDSATRTDEETVGIATVEEEHEGLAVEKDLKLAEEMEIAMSDPRRGLPASELEVDCNIRGRKCRGREPDSDAAATPACVAERQADCARSIWACRIDGRCTARDGRCVAGSDADCEQSYRCRRDGWCSEIDGKCAPADDADCADSRVCELFGHCTEVGGACGLPERRRQKFVRRFLRGPAETPGGQMNYPLRGDYRRSTPNRRGPPAAANDQGNVACRNHPFCRDFEYCHRNESDSFPPCVFSERKLRYLAEEYREFPGFDVIWPESRHRPGANPPAGFQNTRLTFYCREQTDSLPTSGDCHRRDVPP